MNSLQERHGASRRSSVASETVASASPLNYLSDRWLAPVRYVSAGG